MACFERNGLGHEIETCPQQRLRPPSDGVRSLSLALAQSAPAASQTGAPTVSTGRVNDVRGTSAALLGTVNPHGLPTTYVFQYGPSISYGSQTPSISVGAGQNPVRVSQTVANLPLGSHYRIVAANSAGTRAGHDQSYTSVKRKLKFAMEDTKQLAPTPYGGTFVLQGTLTGVGGALQTISLQSSPYPYLTAFVNVGSALTTNAAGAFAIPVQRLDEEHAAPRHSERHAAADEPDRDRSGRAEDHPARAHLLPRRARAPVRHGHARPRSA